MQFSVPQYIEVEDKIVGPLTFKQFVYLLGGAGMAFILWKFLPSFIAIIVILPVAGLSLALAFYKVNNRPFIFMLQSAIKYTLGSKLYVWHKEEKKVVPRTIDQKPTSISQPIPKINQSRLKDLAWSLDVQEKVR